MFCPNCGTQNAADAAACVKCGTALHGGTVQPAAPAPVVAAPGASPRPNNYLVQAILVTLFCCLPLGIVAIVFAAQVNGHFDRGDLAAAEKTSKQAKMWCWISLAVGLGATLLWFATVGLSIISGIVSSGMH